jgi:anti-sigma factor RsiW
VLSWEDGGAIVSVSGSASEEELETVAAAVAPYSG